MNRYTRKSLPQELSRMGEWPSIGIAHLDENGLARFSAIRDVIETYLGGLPVRAKLEALGMPHSEMLRRLNRCVAFDGKGGMVGWRALLPGYRVAGYTRRAEVVKRPSYSLGGYAGALAALFVTHPRMQEQLDKFLLTACCAGSVPESRVTPAIAHIEFLRLCKIYGVAETEWPNCVARLGVGAIAKYTRRFQDEHYDAIVKMRYGKTAAAKACTGTGHLSRLQATLPYDIAEIDEHKAHFLGAVGVPTPKGLRYVPIERVQIILIADRYLPGSCCILG